MLLINSGFSDFRLLIMLGFGQACDRTRFDSGSYPLTVDRRATALAKVLRESVGA